MQVSRAYSPALMLDEHTLICKAPTIVPGPVPARPRARVGFMLNMRFDTSGTPVNLDEVLCLRSYSSPLLFII